MRRPGLIAAGLVGLAVCAPGCTSTRAERIAQTTASALPAAITSYRVGCGDVLELHFRIRPDWDSLCSVDVDGTLPLPESLGRPRVQGLTVEEIRTAIAESGSLDADGITVQLIDPRAATVMMMGPVNGQARRMAYCGPEPVLEFLVRHGAIQAGTSNVNRVYVLRPNVAVGAKSELFHVDIDAVALDNDQRTNVTLRPGDQIYVGETQRSSFSRLLPAWARPMYRSLVGMLPVDRFREWELKE